MSRPGSVELQVDGLLLTFASLADFEFCLDARTLVPARKVRELMAQPAEQLREEARNIRRTEQRFTEVLARGLERPESLATSLRAIDRQLFSQDYRWRSIMAAVNALPDGETAFRHMAMARYLQYLRSRQEALRAAYVELRGRESAPLMETAALPASPQALRETAIFEVGELPVSTVDADGFTVLPRGQTVRLRSPEQTLSLLLSTHRFELSTGAEPALCEPGGQASSLRHGRNVIGRDLGSDVVVDAAFRDVSRRHLVLDLSIPGWLQLTDLSSHGTRIGARLHG